MSADWITLEREDGIAHLRLHRPPVNQFDAPLLEGILAAVGTIGEETRALVVSSDIEGCFAAGGDIPWMAGAQLGEQLDFVALCQDTYTAFERVTCPAVIAIDGHALGGGLELALCCDIRVVSRTSSLGLPESNIGLIAGAGGTQRLVRAIGQGVARDMLLTGRRIDGAEALALGLASRLVEPGEATAEALEIARGLADGPAEAIAATKRLAVAASEVTIDEGLARERAEWAQMRPSRSTQEGLSAFAERRRPDFDAARRGETPPGTELTVPPSSRRVGAEAVVVDCGNELGETPVWDAAAECLHWVDIFAGAVWSLDPSDGATRTFEHGTVVGSVVPRERGGLVLAAGRALVATALDGTGAETLVEVEPDRPENRFNDCRVDPAGRFFGGTKVNAPGEEGLGALYRIGADLRPSVAIADTGIANGIGWSPDGATLYFIDSPLQRLDAYEFDPASGELGARRTVARIDPDDGLPDGLTVDAEGGIWVALANGWALRRYCPEGRIEAELRLPVRNPTCPGFGGPDLGTLYLTSAHLRDDPTYADESPLAGALFALDVGVAGLPIPPFAG